MALAGKASTRCRAAGARACGGLWGRLADGDPSPGFPLRSPIVDCEHDPRRHRLQRLPRHHLGRAILEAELLACHRDHLYRRHCPGRRDVLLCGHSRCVGWCHRERVFGPSLSDRAIILEIAARPKTSQKPSLPPRRFRFPSVSGYPARRFWPVPAESRICISRKI